MTKQIPLDLSLSRCQLQPLKVAMVVLLAYFASPFGSRVSIQLLDSLKELLQTLSIIPDATDGKQLFE
jgi:hypothetical protein